MSKPASAPPAAPAADLPFEAALQQLEAIVEAMEAEDLPLETLLVRYAEGTRLAAHCEKRLAEAELKVQQLTRQPDGEISLQPFPTGTRE